MDPRIIRLVQIHTFVVMDPNSASMIGKFVKVQPAVLITHFGCQSLPQCSHTITSVHCLYILVQMAVV